MLSKIDSTVPPRQLAIDRALAVLGLGLDQQPSNRSFGGLTLDLALLERRARTCPVMLAGPYRKYWDAHVADAELVARTEGFRDLRDRIIERARPRREETVLDLGSGTGLLALAIAPHVDTVWAVDISPAMCDYLRTKAESAGLDNIKVAVASAVSLPLVEGAVDVVISNYCLHHLRDRDKQRAVLEALRVLRPGGRLVIGDMMFRVGISDARDRHILTSNVMRMLRKGPAGVWRLLNNFARLLTRRWEHPTSADSWVDLLTAAGFEDVHARVLDHEGGIVTARRPAHAHAVRVPYPLAA